MEPKLENLKLENGNARDSASIFREACRISTLVFVINNFCVDPKLHIFVWRGAF